MNRPDGPIELGDFTADVAQRIGGSAEELTRRGGTEAREDVLLQAAAREERTELRREEVIHALGEQYTPERMRLLSWFSADLEWIPGQHALRPVAGDGELYPIPEWDDIEIALRENQEFYAAKFEQGFTRLLIVPEGAELSALLSGANDELMRQGKKNALDVSCYANGGLSLSMVGVENMARMQDVGYVDEFSKKPRSKKQRLRSQGAHLAWRVYLVQDIEEENRENVPLDETATLHVGKAPIITARRGGKWVESVLGRGKMRGEVGLTPEAYVALSMQYTLDTGRLLDMKFETTLLGVRPNDERDGVLFMTRSGQSSALDFNISDLHWDTDERTTGTVTGVRTAVPVRFSEEAARRRRIAE